MTSRSTHQDARVSVRDKLLVLGLINTLQPVKPRVVSGNLPERYRRDRFKVALAALRKDKAVLRLPDGRYVVSFRGRGVLSIDPLAKARDVARMLHLFERSKGGRQTA